MTSKFSNGEPPPPATQLLPPEEEYDNNIDQLNDETFGCDLTDINDDWENEHELLAQYTTPQISVQSMDRNRQSLPSNNNNNDSVIFKAQISPIESGKIHHSAGSVSKGTVKFEDDCEDIVKKSISNFILDDEDFYDDDIYPDFASYECEAQQESQNSKTASSSKKKRNIDLETLRPPSPSILPFDDPFMSSVWRPLSPELNVDDEPPPPPVNNSVQTSSHHESSIIQPTSSKNTDSKILTLEEIEKNINGENNDRCLPSNNQDLSKISKVIRLEDLEAQLLSPPKPMVVSKPEYSPQTISVAQNNQLNNMAASLQNSSNNHHHHINNNSISTTSTIQLPIQFLKDKMLTNNKMELAAMSLGQLSLSNSKNMPSVSSVSTSIGTPTTIPASPLKVVPPPPGLGTNFTNLPHPRQMTQSPVVSDKPASTSSSSSVSNQANLLQAIKTSTESFQSQILMNNSMMSAAFANMTPQQQLAALRAAQPPMLSPMALPHQHHLQMSGPMGHPNLKMSMPPINPSGRPLFHLDPMVQQEQQRIINKIITPAQAIRSYPAHFNNFMNTRNIDKFAGFMTQKEKEWLIKIFRLQCKVNDPYVEDYYEVNFNLKKSLIQKLQTLAKEKNQIAEDLDIDSFLANQPLIVLPELAKVEVDKPKYIQFDNALGKIQVLNTKCPRKLLDIDTSSGSKICTYKLDSFSKYLIKIEKLYEHLLNIEDEDKRMPILPDSVKKEHREKRLQLCQTLFDGLMKPRVVVPCSVGGKKAQVDSECVYFKLIKRNMPTMKQTNLEVDTEIMNVNKGLFLVYRSLFQLNDENQLVVIISSLLKGDNFRRFVIDPEQNSKTCYGSTLVKAVARLQQSRSLIYVAASIDDIEVITHNKYGYRLLVTFFNQYKASEDKLLFIYFWKLFVQVLVDQVTEYPELSQLCKEQLSYLSSL